MIAVPPRFFEVRYVADRYPGNATGLDEGANCQHFAYELLRHFGFVIAPLRSSELWADEAFSTRVEDLAPFDLVLFNETPAAYGAHVGVCVDPQRILHLCRALGTPALWTLDQFLARPRYAVRVGIKRPIVHRTSRGSRACALMRA